MATLSRDDIVQELASADGPEAVWKRVEPFLAPGGELSAQYAFQDLWESLYGNH
jgi:hypothetical protein